MLGLMKNTCWPQCVAPGQEGAGRMDVGVRLSMREGRGGTKWLALGRIGRGGRQGGRAEWTLGGGNGNWQQGHGGKWGRGREGEQRGK